MEALDQQLKTQSQYVQQLEDTLRSAAEPARQIDALWRAVRERQDAVRRAKGEDGE